MMGHLEVQLKSALNLLYKSQYFFFFLYRQHVYIIYQNNIKIAPIKNSIFTKLLYSLKLKPLNLFFFFLIMNFFQTYELLF